MTDSDSTPSWAETLIVGGSLGGLTTALALARRGRASTVLERRTGHNQRGVAIGVNGNALRRLLSESAFGIVERALGVEALRQRTYPVAWWDLYSALREAADADALVSIVDGIDVVEVGQDDDTAWARTAGGQVWRADALLGADGYRSVVRRYVDAAHPSARYAGYVVWLGQSELPAEYVNRVGGPDFVMHGNDMLGTYPLIDPDGQLRRFGWGWFDPNHNSMLRQIGTLTGAEIQHTPRAADVPAEIYEAMIRKAARWDEPWRSGLIDAFRTRDVIAAPITEYVPQQVTHGRLAVLGDAAHAQTPMTGSGFDEALEDAEVLADVLPGAHPVTAALEEYEATRIDDMRRRVEGGQSFSRAFSTP